MGRWRGRRALRHVWSAERPATSIGLVDDLIEMSRLDAGTAALQLEDTDVAAAVEGCLDLRGWTDQVAVDIPAGTVVRVDPRRFDVIVANLVGNALRHGAPPVTIRRVSFGGKLGGGWCWRSPTVVPALRRRCCRTSSTGSTRPTVPGADRVGVALPRDRSGERPAARRQHRRGQPPRRRRDRHPPATSRPGPRWWSPSRRDCDETLTLSRRRHENHWPRWDQQRCPVAPGLDRPRSEWIGCGRGRSRRASQLIGRPPVTASTSPVT